MTDVEVPQVGSKDAAPAAKARKSSNVIPALIIAVGLVAGGLLVKWPSGDGADKVEKAPEATPGELVEFEPMTMSLVDGHLLRIGAAIELVEGVPAKEWEEKGDLSRFKDLVISRVGQMTAEDVTSKGGRSNLKEVLLKASADRFHDQVSNVYLTELLVQ